MIPAADDVEHIRKRLEELAEERRKAAEELARREQSEGGHTMTR